MSEKIRKSVTSFDVAKLAGVSRSMVSRAFTDGADISEESRAKVKAAAAQLGYRVNHLARGLQTRHSELVGIVASALDTPFRSRQVKIAARECILRGYRPILLVAEKTEEVEQLISMLFNYNVAGMIITSAAPSSEIVREANSLDVPIVLINRECDIDGPDVIEVDLVQAGELAFSMLTRSGAKRLAVIQPKYPSFSVTGRANSFRECCLRNDVDVKVFTCASQSYQAGFDVGGELGVSLKDIDGVFCSTDLIALGVLDRLRGDWNTKVPEELEIVGFDNIEQAGWGSYNLSTIYQNADEQATAAVELMVDRIKNPGRAPLRQRQLVTPVFRKTTRNTHEL
ncbi:LacI family DNA-binding transcriptional regulator [Celeribacter halophilus]|uniref:LacI family DNA-binding transcriptional regulator n=1 Tax=Celeribacter halophilus TaxID=576117 RepID=UPI003A931AEA